MMFIDDSDIANVFNDYFASVDNGIKSNHHTHPLPYRNVVPQLNCIHIDVHDVTVISELKNNLSAGLDGLTSLIFQAS